MTVTPKATDEALVNPGMGWVYYHFSNRLWAYGGLTEPGDTLDWFPGVSTVYLRVPWCVLEPEEGVFRWDLLDSYAQPFIDKGLRVGLRVTCCESRYVYATPEWVRKAGAKGAFFKMRKGKTLGKQWKADDVELWDPDYTDPVYLAKLEHFLSAMAARYDGNPSIDFVDIGTFGMWGEGHGPYGVKLSPERREEALIGQMKLYRRLFPRTYVVISDDIAGGRNPADDAPLMKHARELGVGFRDDSILVYVPDGTFKSWWHDGWARRFEAAGLPVVVECEHYDLSVDRGAWDSEKLLEAVERYQASWLSLHGWPRRFFDGNRSVIDRINRRLGYRLELRRATWPERVTVGARVEISSTWANVGVARCHVGGCVAWTLLDAKGNVCWSCADETWNVRELDAQPSTHASVCHFGYDHDIPEINDAVLANTREHGIPMAGPKVPTLRPGTYTLCVSVGRPDATPVIALPLKDGVNRRYPLGTITVEPPATLDVRDFGAKGDGVTKDTAAIQRAIDACARTGGRVVLANGRFLTGTLVLRSHVDFHLDASATLLGSPDCADYPERSDVKHVVSAYLPRERNACLIYAEQAEDISLSGAGTIDCNGFAFVRRRTNPNAYQRKRCPYERIPGLPTPPRVVFLAGCRDVRITDVKLVNGPAGWSYWVHDCDRVSFDRVSILAGLELPNNDGIHVNCSRDVAISNCRIETGDDSIVVRANSRSLAENRVCERVRVTNCRLRSHCSCIRISYLNDGIVRDCAFSNLTMGDSYLGIRVELPKYLVKPDRGCERSLVENLAFSDIAMRNVLVPVTCTISPTSDTLCDAVRNLRFCRVTAVGGERAVFSGREANPLADFVFEDCRFELAQKPEFRHCTGFAIPTDTFVVKLASP